MRTSKQFEFRVVVMCDLEGYSKGCLARLFVWRGWVPSLCRRLLSGLSCAGELATPYWNLVK